MSGTADVEARVRELLAQVLDVPASEVGPGFTEASTANWTSLNHLMLVSQLESEFGLFLSNLHDSMQKSGKIKINNAQMQSLTKSTEEAE